MSPSSADGVVTQALAEQSEIMGTMDYTPYLLMRGWEYSGRSSFPGLDYLIDPLSNTPILCSVGVSRQLVRDGIEQDPIGFMQHARYMTLLPEPLLTQVRNFRRRQVESGVGRTRVPPEPIPPSEVPVTQLPRRRQGRAGQRSVIRTLPLRARPEPEQPKADPVPEPKPEPKPEPIVTPYKRTFNFGDRE